MKMVQLYQIISDLRLQYSYACNIVPLAGTMIWSEKCIEWTTLCPIFKTPVKKSPKQLLLQGLESILVAWIQKAITGTL